MRVAYVVKRYPRYSETFIVNEILAHEQAHQELFIYALLPPQDTHFQDIISRVRAPVAYLSAKAERASSFWEKQKAVALLYPMMWAALSQYPKASAREVLQALELCEHIRKKRITHLHAHFATTATTVSQIASAITGVPYSFTAHAKDIFHQEVDKKLLLKKFDSAQCAITVSDFNVTYLTQQLRVPKQQLKRIYNGLDLDEFAFHSPNLREPVICTVGRLVEKKGISDLIDACALLKERGVVFHCQIIGSGELYQALKQQINSLGMEGQVKMLGSLPQKEVKQYLQQAALFAAPCIVGHDGNRDGLPTVLLEAMAMGTPCISTDVTGIPEVIQHEVTGLMIEQRNPAQLAIAIERLLSDSEFRVSLANNARQKIEQDFDIHLNAARIRQCFCRPVDHPLSDEQE
ncbi:glycosyltransferase family 4 protein [Vibrio sp. JPW-9-11-11]|uniref:glycosyltransferase n=1 Tax=Vibrio sp. JPW-9-11-11 TaxID=1416532 RepID=UPI00159443BF|nr:glycosyltransferase [Vibrio sp. JPW-9-11-11]NVD08484.1 glycosyltransferase family 4 protein [Vibrio sp. JPW-9-11-11]